jgi:hypothetical protein
VNWSDIGAICRNLSSVKVMWEMAEPNRSIVQVTASCEGEENRGSQKYHLAV